MEWDGVPVLPGEGHNFGNTYISAHVDNFFGDEPGLVMPLVDVWILEPDVFRQFACAAWTPVDHDPVPARVAGFFRETGAVPLAMSKFGMEQLDEFEPIYVPHGIPTDIYRPLDKAEVREKIGLPQDAYVCGLVGTNKGNPSRKSLVECCEAFAEFHHHHDEAILYLHTEFMGRAEGINLPSLLDSLKVPLEAIRLADQYRMRFDPLSQEMMAQLYSSFDVLLNPSAGEGFGIPIIEAQACGVPVIASNTTAMPELVKAGWLIEGDPIWTMQRSWQVRPRPADIYEALEKSYALTEEERAAMALAARAHALNYDVNHVFETHMLPAIEQVQERLAGVSDLEVVAR